MLSPGFFRTLFFQKKAFLEKTDFIVFGLGNPGEQYAHTRHNIGFRIADRFSAFLENRKTMVLKNARVITGTLKKTSMVTVVKPTTFMNKSGAAVTEVLKKCGFAEKKQKYIVVVDDINIPFGSFRIRGKGTHGGHNGLRSIIDSVGPSFSRLRVGIGPFDKKSGMIDFVLGNFSETEERQLSEIVTRGSEILSLCTAEPIDAVMNKYN